MEAHRDWAIVEPRHNYAYNVRSIVDDICTLLYIMSQQYTIPFIYYILLSFFLPFVILTFENRVFVSPFLDTQQSLGTQEREAAAIYNYILS